MATLHRASEHQRTGATSATIDRPNVHWKRRLFAGEHCLQYFGSRLGGTGTGLAVLPGL